MILIQGIVSFMFMFIIRQIQEEKSLYLGENQKNHIIYYKNIQIFIKSLHNIPKKRNLMNIITIVYSA